MPTDSERSTDSSGRGPDPLVALDLLDVVGCGIWIYDGQDITYVNRALADITGHSCEELLRPSFFAELFLPEDREMIVARGQARVNGESVPEQYEMRLIARNGEHRTLALHARRFELNSRPVSVVSAVDVTPLRTAERTIRDGSAQVAQLLHSLPAHVIATDAAGKPTFVNAHWLELTGQTMEEAMASGTGASIHPDDVQRASSAWREALQTQQGYDIDYRIRDRFGVHRWQNFRIHPVKSADGRLVGWVSASVDIHDAKELHERLEQANHDLAQALHAKDEVLGLISHELRTPLTTILGNTRLLRKRSDELSQHERSEIMADLEADATRLNSVIENMLVLSRAEASERVELEPARLKLLAVNTVADFRARAAGRTVQLDAPDSIPLAIANPTHYQQVLGNLLSNAHKYSPASLPISVQLRVAGEFVETVVADRGPGLSSEEMSKVFSAFYRSGNHEGVYGIGLGLTVCQRLVELGGGTIAVRERDGGGCEFVFTTPAAPEVDEI